MSLKENLNRILNFETKWFFEWENINKIYQINNVKWFLLNLNKQILTIDEIKFIEQKFNYWFNDLYRWWMVNVLKKWKLYINNMYNNYNQKEFNIFDFLKYYLTELKNQNEKFNYLVWWNLLFNTIWLNLENNWIIIYNNLFEWIRKVELFNLYFKKINLKNFEIIQNEKWINIIKDFEIILLLFLLEIDEVPHNYIKNNYQNINKEKIKNYIENISIFNKNKIIQEFYKQL